jgi:hypothetical protein
MEPAAAAAPDNKDDSKQKLFRQRAFDSIMFSVLSEIDMYSVYSTLKCGYEEYGYFYKSKPDTFANEVLVPVFKQMVSDFVSRVIGE